MSDNPQRATVALRLDLVRGCLRATVRDAMRTFKPSQKLLMIFEEHAEKNFFDFFETAFVEGEGGILDELLSEEITPYNPFAILVQAMPPIT